MGNSVPPDAAHRPVRTCVGCRRAFDKARLTRFVRSGTRIEVDRQQRRPGRGCYVCDNPDCVEKALAKDAARLRRALRLGGIRATVEDEAVRAQWPLHDPSRRRRQSSQQ